MKKWIAFPFLLLLFQFSACKQQDSSHMTQQSAAESAVITGTVTYRERIALPPESVIEISLLDVSRQDAKAILIAQRAFNPQSQVPIAFEIDYSPADIDERYTYVISVRISDQGRLMFINDTHAPVLTHGAGNHVDMTLVRAETPPEVSPSLSGMAADKALKGMFRYMADAAIFRDCRNNKTYPVSMEGQYIELERTYLNSGIEPGKEVMVELKGRLLERAAMEGNSNEVKLIVDKVIKLLPGKTCAPEVHAELLGTYWKLLEVGGARVVTPEGMKEAHLILAGADTRAHGNAGCNNFFGQFKADEESLAFSAVGSTMMACPGGMDTEQAFLQALGATNRYQISGLFMELYDGEQLLARLEAVYF